MKIAQIPDTLSAQILVVGDLMLDRYWSGNTSRISPEAPVPVVHVNDIDERAGGAGNVALNIAALGAKASVVGLTGNDEAASSLKASLEHDNIECHFEQLSDSATITKLRVMSRHQQLIRLDFEDGFVGYDGAGLLEKFEKELQQAQVVVLSDYAKGALRDAPKMISMAKAVGKAVIVDPKGSDFSSYRGATLITPNFNEFEAVVGSCSNEDEIEHKGEVLRKELDLDALLITRSEQGMTLIQTEKDTIHIPTKARDVFDVTGAGDTVISALAVALAAGESFESATILSNLAAGVVVGKLGTATVTVPELRRAMRDLNEMELGMVDEERLVALVQESKAHHETVVMTNGCFDILHTGHVTYLEEAARLGDRLIVAVNDDASVSRLKGPERPVNTQLHRMRVLAALECVDWVIGFDEDTPTRLICNVQPDILVKGGDNDPMKIPGGDCVRASGGRVEIMSFVDDVSTTGIIELIRASEEKC
ncbi:MAG: bifunctional D-glycero-beta-D-manno-heptose-7-phosphate kinase/D-glycero-beta-D-manno-heptose 1-phosphate adenylyltransferase HldE [Chromatiales bacterium]|nr:bifunctional D-glycero-beta-D-manno-heptose-7-phosphate kinase/D-glycero-beta-D-manno-heptose 1-phosphate adenylyltransferase HldE [Chromatiales bacterium]